MRTILVSGASGIVGYGVLKSLRNQNLNLIGTSIYSESPANCFSDKFLLAPKTSDATYLDWLLSTIQHYRVDMIIPCIEDDMYLWNREREKLNKVTFPLLNSNPLIQLCRDKWLFYNHLIKYAPDYAIESSLDNNFMLLVKKFGLPFLLKPRQGFASKGIIYVNNLSTFSTYQHKIGTELMAQPIVGDNNHEYTVSAFFDKNSNLCCYNQLRRKLAKTGFTEFAETVSLNGIELILNRLSAIFKPVGPTNFQFRYASGKLKLLEINPRISSSTSIRSAFGYNESLMSIKYFIDGIVPSLLPSRKGKAFRFTEDFIIYSDI